MSMKLVHITLIAFSFIILNTMVDLTVQPEVQDPMTGEKLYQKNCKSCHKADGSGTRNIPPLAQSDYLLKKKALSIKALLFGLKGVIIVNGEEYDKKMPAVKLTDQEIADVLNFVRGNWGNEAEIIKVEEVTSIRESGEDSK